MSAEAKTLDLNDMTEVEINNVVFAGRGVNELVGLRDVFSDEQICNLPSHPAWARFSSAFKTWVYNAIECIVSEDEALIY